MRQPWCIASIPFIKGLSDSDLSSAEEDQQPDSADDDHQPASAEDDRQPDSADDDNQLRRSEDHQQAGSADDQHEAPSLETLDKNNVENAKGVQSGEGQDEKNFGTNPILGKIFDLQTDISLIAKHVASVPKQDIRELLQKVKTKFSELETVINENTDDPDFPVKYDVNPDIYMVCIHLICFILLTLYEDQFLVKYYTYLILSTTDPVITL